MPSISSISEDPVFPDALLEPCLRTGTPAARATTAAMELMFTVPTRSPPVPTMSRASLETLGFWAFWSMTSTSPPSSAAVSPLALRAVIKPPSWLAVAMPDIICVMAQLAVSRVRSCPATKQVSTFGHVSIVITAV